MLDLNFIREHPNKVKDALIKLHTVAPIDEIIECDEERRELLIDSESYVKHNTIVDAEGVVARIALDTTLSGNDFTGSRVGYVEVTGGTFSADQTWMTQKGLDAYLVIEENI